MVRVAKTRIHPQLHPQLRVTLLAVEAMVVTAEEVVLEAKSLRPQPHLVRQQNRPNRLHRLNQNLSRSYRKRDFRRLEKTG